MAELLVLVVVSALVGATAALTVARATGWGRQTLVTRYVPQTTATTDPTDIPEVVAMILPSVVSITVTATPTTPSSTRPGAGTSALTRQGSGVVVTADGEVVTNHHVISDATSITVTLNDTGGTHRAAIVGTDPSRDLALLRISGVSGLSPARFADSTSVVVGDEVLAVGYAMGLDGSPSVTKGIISALDRDVASGSSTGREVTLSQMLQTDAPISSGDSGGPLVDSEGGVIGINTMVATTSDTTIAENLGFAISSHTVQAALPWLRSGAGGA